MSDDANFDPYHKWLGIPPKDQPPHHYRLLAIDLFERDPDVIDSAADARMMLVRSLQTGKRSELSQRILNEVAAARACLHDAARRQEYDARLKASLASLSSPRQAAEAVHAAAAPQAPRAAAAPPRAARRVAEEAEVLVGELVEDAAPPAILIERSPSAIAIGTNAMRPGASAAASRVRSHVRERQNKAANPLLLAAVAVGGLAIVVVAVLVAVIVLGKQNTPAAPAVANQTPPRAAHSGLQVSPSPPATTPRTPANGGLPAPGSGPSPTNPQADPRTDPLANLPLQPPVRPTPVSPRPPDREPAPNPALDPANPFGEGAQLNEQPRVVQHGDRDVPIAAPRMRELLAECKAFDWTPTTPAQTESLSELMTHFVWSLVEFDEFDRNGVKLTPMWTDILNAQREIKTAISDVTWTGARREAVNRMMLQHAQPFSGVLLFGDTNAVMEFEHPRAGSFTALLLKVSFAEEHVILRDLRGPLIESCIVMGQIQLGTVGLDEQYDRARARVVHIPRILLLNP